MSNRPEQPSRGQDGQSRALDIARAIIGILIVLGFVVTVVVLLILTHTTENKGAMPNIEDISAIYAGLTGIVLGYFYSVGSNTSDATESRDTRRVISLVIVIGFAFTVIGVLLITAFTAEFISEGLELLKAVGSVYSGVIGAVLGYFF